MPILNRINKLGVFPFIVLLGLSDQLVYNTSQQKEYIRLSRPPWNPTQFDIHQTLCTEKKEMAG